MHWEVLSCAHNPGLVIWLLFFFEQSRTASVDFDSLTIQFASPRRLRKWSTLPLLPLWPCTRHPFWLFPSTKTLQEPSVISEFCSRCRFCVRLYDGPFFFSAKRESADLVMVRGEIGPDNVTFTGGTVNTTVGVPSDGPPALGDPFSNNSSVFRGPLGPLTDRELEDLPEQQLADASRLVFDCNHVRLR
jgi:hypothetical protein